MLSIKRYKQDPNHCTISSAASLANFYNPGIDYEFTKEVVKKYVVNPNKGLYTSHVGMLLNILGFNRVKVVTNDLEYLDYQFNKLSKRDKSEWLRSLGKKKNLDESMKDFYKSDLDFINYRTLNNIELDFQLYDHICKSIKKNKPVIVSFNWTHFFRDYKRNDNDSINPKNGNISYHAVVARGFSSKHLHVVDSHWTHYKGRLRQYASGYYKIPWIDFMSVGADVTIPENYNFKNICNL